MEDTEFLQEMASKAARSGSGVTIIQNVHQVCKSDIGGSLLGTMQTMAMMSSMFGIGQANDNVRIDGENDQKLIGTGEDNLRNVTEDEFKTSKEYVVINSSLTIPVISVKRSTTWKKEVHDNKLVNSELDPVVMVRLLVNHNTSFTYVIYFKDGDTLDEISESMDDIREHFRIEKSKLPYVVEPECKSEDDFIVDQNLYAGVHTAETVIYESIYGDKPAKCFVDPHDYFNVNYGFI